MNSIHDLGGMHGFGPVLPDDGDVCRADWEKRAFAVSMLTFLEGLTGTGDANRHAVERLGNDEYLASGYYERVLNATATLLIEHNVITPEELDARTEIMLQDRSRPELGDAESFDTLRSRLLGTMRGMPGPRLEASAQPAFLLGETVRTTRHSPAGHTRLPRYARGRTGRIVAHHGAHVFPDANAHGLGERPQHLYTVVFDARELWGDNGDAHDSVLLDLWEAYLEGEQQQFAT